MEQSQLRNDSTRRQLESTCHELSVAQATLNQMQREMSALVEEKDHLSSELRSKQAPPAGQVATEAELSQRKRALSSAQRDLRQVREERERVEKELMEVKETLKKERERSSQLEEK